MKRYHYITIALVIFLASCAGSGDQFAAWETLEFGSTQITQSTTKTFTIANDSEEKEQHIHSIAFDTGSNAAGHFRIDRLTIGEREVGSSDIVVPPKGALFVTVTYAPQNLEISQANYGGWITGQPKRWIPKPASEIGKEEKETIYQRAIIGAMYDFPTGGLFFVQLVGIAVPGPNGEEDIGAGLATCDPGGGTACYTGGFALDIPQLAPGGPKALEITGPIRLEISGGSVTMQMGDFPLVIYYLRSSEIPQLPSGVNATLALCGTRDIEATGTFDGARLDIHGVSFRVRVALGELTADQIRQGMSALVDFDIPDLEITTIKPLNQGEITLHLETTLKTNPSGNELFDQFLSGANVIAILEGELAF